MVIYFVQYNDSIALSSKLYYAFKFFCAFAETFKRYKHGHHGFFLLQRLWLVKLAQEWLKMA